VTNNTTYTAAAVVIDILDYLHLAV